MHCVALRFCDTHREKSRNFCRTLRGTETEDENEKAARSEGACGECMHGMEEKTMQSSKSPLRTSYLPSEMGLKESA